MIDKKYQIIYCDPPWGPPFYGKRNPNNKTKFGNGVYDKYPTMSKEELINMKSFIDDLSDINCLCFMWYTTTTFEFAPMLMREWGFLPVNISFVWVKTNKNGYVFNGPGNYTSQSCEYVLLGKKQKETNTLLPQKKLVPSVVMEPSREHSRKPNIIKQRINEMYPDFNKIELFARSNDDINWDHWGNEINKFTLRKERNNKDELKQLKD